MHGFLPAQEWRPFSGEDPHAADFEPGDAIVGVAVLFYEAFVYREESSGPPMYGCLDATTGIPSRRLTRAVLNECMAGMEESHTGFGPLRIRVLGLEEFRSFRRTGRMRRLMQQSGLREAQISQVRGFADQRLRNAKDALDPSSRRVSIIVQ